MERPSHIVFHPSHAFSGHAFSGRATRAAAAVSLPLVILWALANGMGTKIADHGGPLVYVPERDDKIEPRTPPPLPAMKILPPLTAAPPVLVIEPPARPDSLVVPVTPPPAKPQPPSAAGPDRAASAIPATHTSPPYPPLALRLGQEGKVTLRLTVLADGHVGKADIEVSSGSIELDNAAQGWIVAHWRYKSAQDKGQPVVSQILATMIFNLKDQR
jgi:protein TonB